MAQHRFTDRFGAPKEGAEQKAAPSFTDRFGTAPTSPTPQRNFVQELSRAKPDDEIARITRDPAWQKLMDAQAALRDYAARPADTEARPEAQRRVTLAGDEVEDRIAELARKYDVTKAFITSLARGETPAAAPTTNRRKPFQDRLSDFLANEKQTFSDMMPSAVKEVGGNVFTSVAGALETFSMGGDVSRTTAVNANERLTGERPAWARSKEEGGLGLGGFSAGAELWEAGQIVGALGETIDTFTEEGQWITYMPDLRWGDRTLAFRNREGHSSPYETGVAASGTELLQQFDVEEKAIDLVMRWGKPLGMNREMAASVAGVGAEVLTDPLLAADLFFGGAFTLKRIPGLLKTESGRKAVTLLENMGTDVLAATSPIGVGKAMNHLGVVKMGTKAINKVARGILDTRVSTRVMPGIDTGMAAGFGIDADTIGIQVRDLFFGRGVSPIDDDELRWLYGGNDLSPTSAYEGRPGLMDKAIAAERAVQKRTMMGITAVDAAITSRIGKQQTKTINGKKVILPDVRVLDEAGMKLRKNLHENAWDLIDSYGLPKTREGMQKVLPRVRQAARNYGFDEAEVVEGFKEAVIAARATALDVGYMASRYDEFVGMIDEVAMEVGSDPARMRTLLEAQHAGVDLKAIRTTGELPEDKLRIRPTKGDMEQYAVFDEALKARMAAEGFNPKLSPLAYLKGVRKGYMRRVIGAKTDPNAMFKALADDRTLMTVKQDALPDVPMYIEDAFGTDAAMAVEDYLSARPPHGLISTVDVADVISKKLGRDVSVNEVAKVVYKDDRNHELLQDTFAMLQSQRATGSGTGGEAGAKWAGTGGLQARRDFDPDELTTLLQSYDLPIAMAQMGRVVGRNARSDEMISSAYRFLDQEGLVLDAKQVDAASGGNIGAGERAAAGEEIWEFSNRQNGQRYVMVPSNKTAWGPLAGKAIPYRVARELVKTVSLPLAQRQSRWEQVINNYRKAMLSPLPTTVVNILGNLNFIRQSGVDFGDMLSNLGRATKARNAYHQTGKVEGLEGAENMLSFFNEGSYSGHLMKQMDQAMEELASATSSSDLAKRTGNAIDKLTEITESLTTDPRKGGFLGWFAWGEEVTRLAAAYAVKDRLMRHGLDEAEAISRAAHVANNSAGDYGALGVIPQTLKRTGLALFPQFAWFNAGRTARAAVERPGTLVKPDYARQLWNASQIEGGEEEQRKLTALSEPWQRHEQPFALRLPGRKPGEYAIGNLSRVNPLGFDQETLVQGPLLTGAYLPFFEYVAAQMLTGDDKGTAMFSQKYGERVFDPDSPTPDWMESLGFLGRSYVMPGHLRMATNVLETARYYQYKDEYDVYNQLVGRFQNRDAAQLVARMLGFSTFKAGTQGESGEISFTRRMNDLERTEGRIPEIDERSLFGLPGRGIDEQIERNMEKEDKFLELLEELFQYAP